jgi:CheY-like chemotaxis protein
MVRKILVVDDKLDELRVWKDVLTAGFPEDEITSFLVTKKIRNGVVTEFFNTKELQKLIQSMRFDAIVTDYNMPHLNGIGLAKFICDDTVNSQTPIIMQTRDGSYPSLDLEARQAGIKTVLDKNKVKHHDLANGPNPLVYAVEDAIAEREKSGRKFG